MGNQQHGCHHRDAGYDVTSNLSSRQSREAACAEFRAAAKSDRRLMRETLRQLTGLRAGLRHACLTPLQRKALVTALEDGIDTGRQRLALATEAGERLLRQPGCPGSVERQLDKLQRACTALEHVLNAALTIVDAAASSSSAGDALRLNWRGTQANNFVDSSESHRKRTSKRADELVRTPLTEANAETVTEYFRVHDRLMRFVRQEHKISFNIKSIERIENRLLDRRMWNYHMQLLDRGCKPELYIHGTKGAAAEKIIREGFKVGTGGMYGAGIYFATDTSKSAQYSKDSGLKSLLVCEVLLGRSMVQDGPRNDLNYETIRAAGFDSVFAKRNTKESGGVRNDEYIVYRPEQATPRYLVKFTV